MEVCEILKQVGLTENEANVYLIVLRAGSATASEILEKTSIHRINLYDILERLQEKGLVSYAMICKRKAYEAVSPKRILEIEEEKLNNIRKIMPELEAQKSLNKISTEATIFKDKAGIRKVLDEIATTKSHEFCYFASGWGFYKFFPEYAEIWASKIKMNKTKARCLISNKLRGAKVIEPVDYKYLPNEFVFPSTTCIYEDKVFILMWSEQPMGILIRSKEVSDSYKQFFEMLWKIARN